MSKRDRLSSIVGIARNTAVHQNTTWTATGVLRKSST